MFHLTLTNPKLSIAGTMDLNQYAYLFREIDSWENLLAISLIVHYLAEYLVLTFSIFDITEKNYSHFNVLY